MMIINVPYNNTIVPVTAWNIGKQKEALLSLDESYTIQQKVNSMFSILLSECSSINNRKLNYIEKIYFMMFVRSRINGENIEISYNCEHCGNYTNSLVDITNMKITGIPEAGGQISTYNIKMLYNGSLEDSVYDINGEINSQNISKFIDSLSIDEYKYLESVYNTCTHDIKVVSTSRCLLCGTIKEIVLDQQQLVDDIIIDTTLQTHYVNMANMRMNLGFTLTELENLLPFEQEVYNNLCNDIIKKRGET